MIAVIEEFTLGQWVHVPGAPVPCVRTLKRKHRGNCWIYCIRRPDTGSVKIGRAWNVAHRLQTLQSGNDVELEVVFAFVCIEAAEKLIHELLSPWHLRGEWFSSSPEVCDWIARQKRQPNVVWGLPPRTAVREPSAARCA